MSVYSYFIHKNDVKHFAEYVSTAFKLDKQLGCVRYHNAYIVPSCNKGGCGVIEFNRTFVDNSALFEGFSKKVILPTDNSIPYHDEDVIYIGCLINIFGHAIMDNIKKLWFLKSAEGQRLINDGVSVVYLAYGGQQLKPHVMQIMKSCGVEVSDFKEITSVGQYRNVIVPDNAKTFDGNKRFYTETFKETINSIVASCKSTIDFYDKIYLSRSSIHDHKDFGEHFIELEFAKRGYKVIHPETLPFVDQVCLVNNCTHFAATLGSVSHLSVFCRPGTNVCILRKSRYINDYQCMIDEMTEANVSVVDIMHSFKMKYPWTGPFYLSRTKYLGEFFKTKYVDMPMFDRLWYKYVFYFFKVKMMNEYACLLNKHSWILQLRKTL